MDSVLFFRHTPSERPDVVDTLEVFLYTNLDTIMSPTRAVVLTPSFQAALVIALNDVGIRHHLGLAKDLKDILDVFIVTNAGAISTGTTP